MAALTLSANAAKPMSVQVRDGQLRSKPSFLGQPIASVSYGDRVTILSKKGDWREVSTGGDTGWIHVSALSKKKIVLKSGDRNVRSGASGEELALAGKGFNADVESKFKTDHRGIDFTWIDTMETYNVSAKEMVKFLDKGNVSPSEGGAE